MPKSAQYRFMSKPNLNQVTCQTCTTDQFNENHYTRFLNEIRQEHKYHRKQWEFIYILRSLEQLGLLAEGVTGLGFGCGKEPLASVMAKYKLKVTVTDIPPFELSDSHWGSQSALDLFYAGICEEQQYLKYVNFRQVDMNNIPDNLGQHDFIWSCCALEHLGSLQAGIDFIINSTKCLKPGGVAIHTTEINVSNDIDTLETPSLSLFRRKDLIDLQNTLFDINCTVMPMNFYQGNQPNDHHIDLPPYEQNIHLKLLISGYVITSFGIILKKQM
jgi:2-polyprenyl-3-methyl-5-hydroxy-6-metoxy-1,4-benzoquinol methylase